jgi:hypothetical protein
LIHPASSAGLREPASVVPRNKAIRVDES